MSAATLQALLYTPPRPVYLADRPGLRQFLRAARTNALLIWPEAAYERDIVVNRMLGRTQLLINAPDAIHRVLVENPGNYRRTPASPTARAITPIRSSRSSLLSTKNGNSKMHSCWKTRLPT